jgi:hypothetical protein
MSYVIKKQYICINETKPQKMVNLPIFAHVKKPINKQNQCIMNAYLVYNGVDLIGLKTNLLASYNMLKSVLPVVEVINLKSYVQVTRDFKKAWKFRYVTDSGIMYTICKMKIENK